MSEGIAEDFVTIVIPEASLRVVEHHQRAVNAIEAMSPSRRLGADTNLRAWRRWIKQIDPTRENGSAFSGVELTAGTTVSLPLGTVMVVCDAIWAQATWYAGPFIKPTEVEASLYEVSGEGLTRLTTSVRRKWARDLVGWLVANRPDVPVMPSDASLAGGGR
jgi:hypothetical protein